MKIFSANGSKLSQLDFAQLLLSSAVALGSFSGMHIGHMALIKEMHAHARTHDLVSVVYMVNKSGKRTKKVPRFMIDGMLNEIKVDYVVVDDWQDIAHFSPEQFVYVRLQQTLRCAAAFCGENFRFGTQAAGDAAHLVELMGRIGGRGFVVPLVMLDGEVVSSTTIQRYLDESRLDKAFAMLGRSISINGKVVHGAGRGRKLGFPTANIPYSRNRFCLIFGVYHTIAILSDGRELPAITHLGLRPTVNDDGEVISETHILDFNERIYGQKLSVHFLEFIRSEQKFESIDDLKSAVNRDIAAAKARNCLL